MPEPTSSVHRQQPDEEPRMSTSATKAWIILTYRMPMSPSINTATAAPI